METPSACADAPPRRAQCAVMATHFLISTVAHREDWRLPAGLLPAKPPRESRALGFHFAAVKPFFLPHNLHLSLINEFPRASGMPLWCMVCSACTGTSCQVDCVLLLTANWLLMDGVHSTACNSTVAVSWHTKGVVLPAKTTLRRCSRDTCKSLENPRTLWYFENATFLHVTEDVILLRKEMKSLEKTGSDQRHVSDQTRVSSCNDAWRALDLRSSYDSLRVTYAADTYLTEESIIWPLNMVLITRKGPLRTTSST